MSIAIEPERPEQRDDIHALLTATFDGPAEADLVDALRAGDHVIAARVAHDSKGIAGYVLFARLGAAVTAEPGSGASPKSEPPRALRAAALAPLAVRADVRGQGVGVSLVHAGLSACRVSGIELVLVLGDPNYYHQFGFRSDLAEAVKCPYSGPNLMALELVPGVLDGGTTTLTYPPPFGIIEEA